MSYDYQTIDRAQLDLAYKLEAIFMPDSKRKRDELYEVGGVHQKEARFVHYTSASAALNIINPRRVWMRNATCMSDYCSMALTFSVICSPVNAKTN